MATFLSLPPELRDAICHHLFSYHISRGSATRKRRTPAYGNSCLALMLTCRQLEIEAAAYLYRSIHLKTYYPDDIFEWVTRIGSKNSSCIENLVLATKALPAGVGTDCWAADSAWALSLRCMPKLAKLVIHASHNPELAPPSPIDERKPNADLLHRLSVHAYDASTIVSTAQQQLNTSSWEYLPDLRSHAFTHGFFSLHETMPSVLVQYFNALARNEPPGTRPFAQGTLDRVSMVKNVTGLSPVFLEQNGFYLINTHVFCNNNENPNAILTFEQTPKKPHSPYRSLRAALRDLPDLGYLRIGCCDLDSSFLVHIPKHVHTLDVAFTDNDAERVTDNLMTMRGICRKLFTLALAVSPLHDRSSTGDHEQSEEFFERSAVSLEMAEKWAPFWQALDEIKASRVKIWEGEGPGFRRESRSVQQESRPQKNGTTTADLD